MSQTRAILLVLSGAVLMSFVGLILRSMEAADGFQILFYRSMALAAAVAVVACLRRGVMPLRFLRSIDRWDVLMGVFMAFAFSFYVYAILNTTVASALFILSSAPIFAAVMGWVFASEKPELATWIAIIMAIVGVGLMVQDGMESGGMVGNIFALISAFSFASMLVLVRWLKRDDALGGTFLGGVFATLLNGALVLSLGSTLIISAWDLGLSLFMGAFTIGIGMALVTWAASYLPASEVSILVLLESVLGPVWVWLFLNETTTVQVVTGGAIVLVAVLIQAMARRRKSRHGAIRPINT